MSRLPHTQSPFPSALASQIRPEPAMVSAPVAGATAALAPAWRERLTGREAEILERLSHGLLYAEIGRELGIRTPTVKNHLHRIYAKIEVRSRTEAVVKWLGR